MGIIRSIRLQMPDMVLITITFTAKKMAWKNI